MQWLKKREKLSNYTTFTELKSGLDAQCCWQLALPNMVVSLRLAFTIYIPWVNQGVVKAGKVYNHRYWRSHCAFFIICGKEKMFKKQMLKMKGFIALFSCLNWFRVTFTFSYCNFFQYLENVQHILMRWSCSSASFFKSLFLNSLLLIYHKHEWFLKYSMKWIVGCLVHSIEPCDTTIPSTEQKNSTVWFEAASNSLMFVDNTK